MTWAPAAASTDAVARPIPREAPVTKAVLLRRAAIFFYLRFTSPPITFFRPMSVCVGSGVHSAIDRKLDPKFLDCEVGMQICREAREVALDSRLEILVHQCLVSLVLGLNGHVYSLWVAATQRSCSRRHAFKNRIACSTKS